MKIGVCKVDVNMKVCAGLNPFGAKKVCDFRIVRSDVKRESNQSVVVPAVGYGAEFGISGACTQATTFVILMWHSGENIIFY